MDNSNKNDAENWTFQIQKIIKEEIEVLRHLLSFLSMEELSLETQNPEMKKGLLRQRSEIFKKLRTLRKEKEVIFENFFFSNQEDLDVTILKDHLSSVKNELDRKQNQLRKTSNHDSFLIKAHLKKPGKQKTTVTTIDSEEEKLA